MESYITLATLQPIKKPKPLLSTDIKFHLGFQ